jgi:hypothetical protein
MPRLSQLCAALLLGICMASERAEPAQPVLTITAGVDTKHFTVGELLSRADLASLEIPPNVDYKVSLTVQAVPLLDLLAAIPLEGLDRLEASATDGFVAQIPLAFDRGRQKWRFGCVDRCRGPKPSLAQAAREKCQCRPLLFGLAISRTVSSV